MKLTAEERKSPPALSHTVVLYGGRMYCQMLSYHRDRPVAAGARRVMLGFSGAHVIAYTTTHGDSGMFIESPHHSARNHPDPTNHG